MSTLRKFDRRQVIEDLKKIYEVVYDHAVLVTLGIRFPLIADTFARKLDSMKSGIMDLNIQEMSTIWGGMFRERNIVYMRATSLIPPSIWQNPFMAKYDAQQRENAKYLTELDAKEQLQLQEMAKRVFVDRGMNWLGDALFERTFIITNDQLADPELMADLVNNVCHQSEAVDLKICYEGDLAAGTRRDFGIVVSKDEEIWLYELVILHNSLYGGKIISNPDRIREATDIYRDLHALSEPVPHATSFESVVRLIGTVCKRPVDLDVLRGITNAKVAKAGHKCLGCFVESERTISAGQWHTLHEAKKVWYEMLVAENEAVTNYVKLHKPKSVIEVGCGPGRFLKLLSDMGLDAFEEIVAIDCDAKMCEKARNRFDKERPKIEIVRMEVSDYLPYDDNDFDLCINAMNIVGWQQNEKGWLREMLRCSKCVFFTVFKAGNEELRIDMYRERGHQISNHAVHKDANGQIVLGDCAVVPNVISKSYTESDIHQLCGAVSNLYDNCVYEVDGETNRLLYLCFIYKKDLVGNLNPHTAPQ